MPQGRRRRLGLLDSSRFLGLVEHRANRPLADPRELIQREQPVANSPDGIGEFGRQRSQQLSAFSSDVLFDQVRSPRLLSMAGDDRGMVKNALRSLSTPDVVV